MNLKIEELNRLYTEADSADKETYAEMRGNVLLIAGDHYHKRLSRTMEKLRDSTSINDNQKVRITKNHTQKVVKGYVASIHSLSPGVAVLPNNEKEIQDQKSAELNQSVWTHFKGKLKLKAFFRERLQGWVGIGEVAHKCFWDLNKGTLKGYEPTLDPDGQPVVDPTTGKMSPDDTKPVFSGEFVFESILPFNLFRHPDAISIAGSELVGIRKLVKTSELKKKYKGDPSKIGMISDSSKEEFYVAFDSATGNYSQRKDETLVKEYYFKPCYSAPKGYYYLTTTAGILEEGELPEGIFPIIWKGFDEHETKPRATSIVKVIRPYQAEVNRAASQQVQHQITVGDDKVIYQQGTKLSTGALLPGVRGVQYQGMNPPTIIPGRDGSQFAGYSADTIAELYSVVSMAEELEGEAANTQDPNAALFKSMKQQKKFSVYAEKWEEYLIESTELFLKLAKVYLPDDALIPAIGRGEIINIAEFRNTEPQCYQIKIEAKQDTLETMFGKQLSINQALQYVGGQLEREDIGRLLRAMPFANMEEAFDDLTMDYDMAKNMMLALERGENPPVNQNGNSDYILKKLTHRTTQSDFGVLPPEVQQLYYQKIQEYQALVEEQLAKEMALKNEYIPVGGALVGCDMYVPSGDTGSSKRVRVPYQSLDWLIKTLERQGMSLEVIANQSPGTVADMSNHLATPQDQINQQNQVSPYGMAAMS